MKFDARAVELCGGAAAVMIDGEALHLRPWTLSDHLDALDAAASPSEGPIEFDVSHFSTALLRRAADLDTEESAGLEEVALWWALGGPQQAATIRLGPDGKVGLAGGYARLRPWTWRERRLALAACVPLRDGKLGALDAVGLLRRQVQASVIEVVIDGEARPPATIAGPNLHTLLDAVLRINSGGVEVEVELVPPAIAAATLRICRGYGWTPTQVDAAPAAEIEAMLRLLDAATPAPAPGPALRSGLARFPDAVVIEIDGT